jgi:hypothetical protein
MNESARPPFDDADRATVARYLEKTNRYLVDLSGAAHEDDPYYRPSLAAIEHFLEGAFGARLADGTPFRVYPAFFEWSVPRRFAAEAFAKTLPGLHICAIETGLVAVTFELACFCFSQSEFFKEVGDPGVEDSPALPAQADLGYWIADRIAAASGEPSAPIGEELISRDPERRLMAHFLSQLMLRFVWLHEFYHGMNGHAGWIASKSGTAELTDVSMELSLVEIEKEDVGEIPWTRALHLIELDADRAALWSMVQMQRRGEEIFELLAERPERFRLKLVLFASVMMTFLFAQSDKRRAKENISHPASELRLQNILGTIATNLDDPPDLMPHLRADVFHELHTLQDRIPSLATFDRVRDGVRKPGTLNALDELEADLNILRKSLVSFACRPE